QEGVFLFVSSIGIQVVGDSAVFSIRSLVMSDCLMNGRQERHVLLQHFLLSSGRTELQLHDEVPLVCCRFYFRHFGACTEGGYACNLSVAPGQTGPIRGGDHFVKSSHPVLSRIQQPRCVVDTYECVQRKCLSEIRATCNALCEIV